MTPRKVLVTGSTRGIGLAIAESLVSDGASVLINGRRQQDVDAVVSRLASGNAGRVHGLAADLSDHRECERLVDDAVNALGGLDVLINNAGLGTLKPIQEMSWSEWRQQIDVNLGAVWACTRAAIPHLRGSGDAWVINIGSLASRNAFAKGTGYNASKFGLLGMTEAMMLDLRTIGIRVSIVMPGSVNTEFSGPAEASRGWKLEPADCALAVRQLLQYPKGAHVSRIEMRPANPK
jgi:NAD(P)-dependent dehydrogenase (short-subunit alcohol dehydrogenase family)